MTPSCPATESGSSTVFAIQEKACSVSPSRIYAIMWWKAGTCSPRADLSCSCPDCLRANARTAASNPDTANVSSRSCACSGAPVKANAVAVDDGLGWTSAHLAGITRMWSTASPDAFQHVGELSSGALVVAQKKINSPCATASREKMGRAGWRAQPAEVLHLRAQIKQGRVRSDAGCRQRVIQFRTAMKCAFGWPISFIIKLHRRIQVERFAQCLIQGQRFVGDHFQPLAKRPGAAHSSAPNE